MGISAHQINNVLRVYGNLIRQRMIPNGSEGTEINGSEMIGISAKFRRKNIVDDITSNIIKRITQPELHENAEKEGFKPLKNEHGKPLFNNGKRHKEIIFKEINGNDETLNSLSLEDFK